MTSPSLPQRVVPVLLVALAMGCVLAASPVAADEPEVLFTSANGRGEARLAARIEAGIRGAERSIDIAVAHLNYERIARAIVERAGEVEGLTVRVLLDRSEYGARSSQCKLLEDGGVPVRYKFYSLGYYHFKATLMHHKFMIVDGSTLFAGSYNWSETAEKKNDENLIVFGGEEHADLVGRFAAEFDELWELGRDVYPAVKARFLADPTPRYLPVHFNTAYFGQPMALTRDEIEPLMRVAGDAGLFGDRKNFESTYWDTEKEEGLDRLPSDVGSFLGDDDEDD